MIQTFKRLMVCVAVLGACSCISVRASLLGINTIGGGLLSPGGSLTGGNAFSLSVPLTIDGLGYFDFGSNGLVESHDVGIWTSVGAVVIGPTAVTTTSALKTSASTFGDWRITSIAPFVLPIGNYVIAGYDPTGADLVPVFDTYLDLAGVSRTGFITIGGGALAFPTLSQGFNASPVTFTVVPEPSTFALFGLVGAGIALMRRRRNKLAA